MRDSNYSYPPQNRATLLLTHLMYDRRALDTTSPLAILNNLTSLTYLTQTSPRIREILTLDGGLERLIDILRDSCLPRERPGPPDWWGLNGPPTARVIDVDRQIALRHSLAFQCVVNIGVRGSEQIRTRVVQAGALDLVSQILETWLKQRGVAIFAGSLGSQAAVDAVAAGLPIPGVEERRRGSRSSRHAQQASGATVRANSIAQFVSNLTGMRQPPRPTGNEARNETRPTDTDVEMADGEGGDEGTDTASAGGADDNMDVDDHEQDEPQAGPSTTPRARQTLLPMPVNIPARTIYSERRDAASQTSSAGNSLSGEDPALIPRANSDNNLAASGAQAPRPPPLNLSAARIPSLAQDTISNQSSPMGTPTRAEMDDSTRSRGRRGTIIGRPVNINLAPRNERRRDAEGGSGTSDGGEDVDLPAAIVAAGIAAANAQAMEGGGTVVPDEPGPPPDVEIVEGAAAGLMPEEPDAEALAAEQARLDMEAGAPPGQPGAAQTPRVPPAEGITPLDPATATAQQQTQIIIANGAPRGFHDLGSYVGISSLLNPDGDIYSDDSILLALQLLAYLSKYPHVRTAFHYPNRPMHPTFNLGIDNVTNPLPERPTVAESPNVFSLVERFTFKPAGADPTLRQLPKEIQYWAGVIMRNACRKDEAQGGIRQCANMTCGKWESFPREFAKCRRCRKAKYCSKECQSRAWSEGHRFWCNTRTDDGPGGPAAEGAAGGGPGGGGRGGGDDDDELVDGDVPPEILSRIQAARLNGGMAPGGANAFGFTGTTQRNVVTLDEGVTGNPISPQQQMNLLQQTFAGAGGAGPAHRRGVEGNNTAAREIITMAERLGVRPEQLIAHQREQQRARMRTAEGEERTLGVTVGLLPNGAMRDIAETRHRQTSHGPNTRPATANNSPLSGVPDRLERNQLFEYTNGRATGGVSPGQSRTTAVANSYSAGRALTPVSGSVHVSSPPINGARGLLSQTDTVLPGFTRQQLPGRGGEGSRGRQR